MTYVVCIFFFLNFMCAYRVLASLIKRKLRANFTALEDIPLLGVPKPHGHKIQGTAVICGGSIAGLLSARVCADHFEQVIIVEPEAWVATEEGLSDRHREVSTPQLPVSKRSRIAQYTAAHVYQSFTLLALRKLFPNIENELRRAGARILQADAGLHLSGIALLVPYHKYPKDGLPKTIFFSRPGYETVLRRMVLSTCSNVKYVTGSVTGLVPHKSLSSVSSVTVRSHANNETSVVIPASLVVDCTGPARGGLRWLQNAPFTINSYTKSKETTSPLNDLKKSYDPKMNYVSCEFNVPPALLDEMNHALLSRSYENDATLYAYLPTPPWEGNTFHISRREHNYLQIVCGGWNFRGRIGSISDIKHYVSRLKPIRPIPEHVFALLNLLEQADVLATYVHTRIPPAIYVEYFRAVRIPSNFVAIGDAVLQLNPVRGNGCSKACVDAVTLNSSLVQCVIDTETETIGDSLPKDFAQNFFAAQARRTGKLWQSQKVGDYAWSTTVPATGEDPKSHGAWTRWYNSKIFALATKDREVASVVWHIGQFLAPPTDLFSPHILVKVAWTLLERIFVR